MMDLQIIQDVECFIDGDGVAQLKLEHVARGLGFTQVAASGNVCVRWERVDKYISDLSIPTSGDDNKRPEFIPEPVFYLLCMKAENETAKAFQHKVAMKFYPQSASTGCTPLMT